MYFRNSFKSCNGLFSGLPQRSETVYMHAFIHLEWHLGARTQHSGTAHFSSPQCNCLCGSPGQEGGRWGRHKEELNSSEACFSASPASIQRLQEENGGNQFLYMPPHRTSYPGSAAPGPLCIPLAPPSSPRSSAGFCPAFCWLLWGCARVESR